MLLIVKSFACSTRAIFELIKSEMEYVRDLEAFQAVSNILSECFRLASQTDLPTALHQAAPSGTPAYSRSNGTRDGRLPARHLP